MLDEMKAQELPVTIKDSLAECSNKYKNYLAAFSL
jgi:hypothetical protein